MHGLVIDRIPLGEHAILAADAVLNLRVTQGADHGECGVMRHAMGFVHAGVVFEIDRGSGRLSGFGRLGPGCREDLPRLGCQRLAEIEVFRPEGAVGGNAGSEVHVLQHV